MDNRAGEMQVFLRVVDTGSFSEAARMLKMTPSTISKLIGRIETRLGVRLLERSTRRLSLTNEGQAYYDRSQALLTDLEANFAARTRALIDSGRTDFDIELQVLRDRLAREGVRMPDPAQPALEDRKGVDLTDLLRATAKAGRKTD